MTDVRVELIEARDQCANAEYRRDLLPVDSDGWRAWDKTFVAWQRQIRQLEKKARS